MRINEYMTTLADFVTRFDPPTPPRTTRTPVRFIWGRGPKAGKSAGKG